MEPESPSPALQSPPPIPSTPPPAPRRTRGPRILPVSAVSAARRTSMSGISPMRSSLSYTRTETMSLAPSPVAGSITQSPSSFLSTSYRMGTRTPTMQYTPPPSPMYTSADFSPQDAPEGQSPFTSPPLRPASQRVDPSALPAPSPGTRGVSFQPLAPLAHRGSDINRGDGDGPSAPFLPGDPMRPFRESQGTESPKRSRVQFVLYSALILLVLAAGIVAAAISLRQYVCYFPPKWCAADFNVALRTATTRLRVGTAFGCMYINDSASGPHLTAREWLPFGNKRCPSTRNSPWVTDGSHNIDLVWSTPYSLTNCTRVEYEVQLPARDSAPGRDIDLVAEASDMLYLSGAPAVSRALLRTDDGFIRLENATLPAVEIHGGAYGDIKLKGVQFQQRCDIHPRSSRTRVYALTLGQTTHDPPPLSSPSPSRADRTETQPTLQVHGDQGNVYISDLRPASRLDGWNVSIATTSGGVFFHKVYGAPEPQLPNLWATSIATQSGWVHVVDAQGTNLAVQSRSGDITIVVKAVAYPCAFDLTFGRAVPRLEGKTAVHAKTPHTIRGVIGSSTDPPFRISVHTVSGTILLRAE